MFFHDPEPPSRRLVRKQHEHPGKNPPDSCRILTPHAKHDDSRAPLRWVSPNVSEVEVKGYKHPPFLATHSGDPLISCAKSP